MNTTTPHSTSLLLQISILHHNVILAHIIISACAPHYFQLSILSQSHLTWAVNRFYICTPQKVSLSVSSIVTTTRKDQLLQNDVMH
jgi:hypothetical protein